MKVFNGWAPFYLMVAVYLLVCCAPKTGTSRPASSPAAGTAPAPIFDPLAGTSDQGGGGNLIKGRPLDAYIIPDVTALPFYKKIIAPMDLQFSKTFLPDNEVSFFKNIAKSKTWYLLPISFKKLPKEQIGVGFATSQGAIQNAKEIFLSEVDLNEILAEDDAQLAKMTLEERQAWLVAHEIIMAFYRYKFESFKTYCPLYYPADYKNLNQCAFAKFDNGAENLKPIAQKEFLLPQQYEPIRHMTHWIFENYRTTTKNAIWLKFYEKGFDPRFFNFKQMHSLTDKSLPELITREHFLKRLMVQQTKGTLPYHCGYDDSFRAKARRTCQINFIYENESLKVSIQVFQDKEKVGNFDYLYPFPIGNSHGQKAYSIFRATFGEGLIYYDLHLRSPYKIEEMRADHRIHFLIENPKDEDWQIKAVFFDRMLWVSEVAPFTGAHYKSERIPLQGLERLIEVVGDAAQLPGPLDELRTN